MSTQADPRAAAGQVSRTSLMAAVCRGQHRLRHAPPWVLDDPFALDLVGAAAPEVWARLSAALPPAWHDPLVLAFAVRARWMEDQLLDGDVEQYVILGAGLDSFAWRRPELVDRMTVFEVDHPASQAYKRQRMAELGLPAHPHHRFVPVDFETGTLADGLAAAAFDPSRPTYFSWQAVTMYLTGDAVQQTLRTLATLAPGARVGLSYIPKPAGEDDPVAAWFDVGGRISAASGEPWLTVLTRPEAEALLTETGFAVRDHPDLDELHARYLADRPDDAVMGPLERVICGEVG